MGFREGWPPFVYWWFLPPWRRTGKPEHCLWVRVKRDLKHNVTSGRERRQTTPWEPARQILKGDKEQKRHLFSLTRDLTNFLRLPQVQGQTHMILKKDQRFCLLENTFRIQHLTTQTLFISIKKKKKKVSFPDRKQHSPEFKKIKFFICSGWNTLVKINGMTPKMICLLNEKRRYSKSKKKKSDYEATGT